MNLFKRIIVAIVLIPIVWYIIFFRDQNPLYYRITISIIISAAAFEFLLAQRLPLQIINHIFFTLALLTLVNLDFPHKDYEFGLAVFTGLILIILTTNYIFLPPDFFFKRITAQFFALIYLGLFGLHFNLLANIDERLGFNNHLIFFVLSFNWICDSGAYFTGRLFGKNKLAPVISPNKTIEGLIGGVIISTIYALFYKKYFMSENISYLNILLLSILLNAACPLGDLCASAIKRALAIKDYSKLIPGHGGLIDRLDSLLYTAPVTVCYFKLLFFLKIYLK